MGGCMTRIGKHHPKVDKCNLSSISKKVPNFLAIYLTYVTKKHSKQVLISENKFQARIDCK